MKEPEFIIPEEVEAKVEQPKEVKKIKINLATMKKEEVEDEQQANSSAN